MMAHDFLMEKRLYHLNRPLHHRFTDAVFALQHTPFLSTPIIPNSTACR